MPAANEAIGAIASNGGSAPTGSGFSLSPLWSSALSSFGSSAGSGLGDALFGGISARRQWKYMQKQMAKQQQYALEQMAKSAEYQLTHDKEMFDYQNAYNDPSKVFDRYLKAGVTPAGVLGSSGVGVNATMSSGSGGAPSASGPSGGSGLIGAGKSFPGDPTAFAQIEVAKSTSERNRAAANLDNANASDILNKLQPASYYKAVADLNKSILEHGVDNAEAVADMNKALATLYQADAEYADLMSTYKFQDFVAQYSAHVEEYEQIRKYNIKYMDHVYAAQITLDFARAYESFKSGRLLGTENEISKVRLSDLQNWFDVNWETNIPVPEVDSNGKPTGQVRRMTGREIFSNLLGFQAAGAQQGLSGSWFQIRSEKNAFGYEMANTAIRGAASIAASYVGAKTLTPPVSSSMEQSVEHYDSGGTYIGGTRVSRRDFRSHR